MFAATGCAVETADGEGIPPAAEEDAFTEQSLNLVAEGGLSLRDVPALTAGAEGTLACADRFALDGRERITCTRGKEITEVILDKAAERAWDEEMCERGYGSGNPLEPGFVTGAVDRGLTPLYRKLSWLAAQGKLTADALDPKICLSDPDADRTFAATAPPLTRFKCGTSTRFEP